ncbi:A-kinase anchor protein 8-like isoform X4 [Eulemur rufifrons]|uniref:A-kinase anchor protein 8-like isoform X4 n=1 Tax=Eulemur rufifrons TaxID=859984 RepID=UPI0037447F6F
MSYTGFVQGSETTLQSTYSDTSAQPTCDYGYGTWNSGTNRGYEGYGYGYGYGQDNTTNYGYGMASSHSWEMPSSDTNANPSASGSASADSVLSRINQRLDMVPHLETDMIQGGMYSSGGERYDSYEACDSRAVLSERDLYRSGYDYGELDPEMEMAYEGQYDAYRDQFRMRGGDTFGPRAQGWARDARSGRPMASGYGRMWEDPMGARGQCMSGASRLPSLFSQNIIPEYGMFQGMRGGGTFPGGSRFGFGFGNGMKQMRRTWKTWTTADFRTKKKKRKQSGSPDEPDSKATRTDCSDNSDSDNDEGTEGEAAEGTEGAEAVEKGSRAEGEDEEGREDGREEGREDPEKGESSRDLGAGMALPAACSRRDLAEGRVVADRCPAGGLPCGARCVLTGALLPSPPVSHSVPVFPQTEAVDGGGPCPAHWFCLQVEAARKRVGNLWLFSSWVVRAPLGTNGHSHQLGCAWTLLPAPALGPSVMYSSESSVAGVQVWCSFYGSGLRVLSLSASPAPVGSPCPPT